MTRLILLVVVLVMAYWLARNIIRGFLRGMGLGNENPRGRADGKKDYRDVQDAEFEDITNKK